MIPRKLALTNFMSYGNNQEPLDFSQIHTACLTGPNGNGKSALLDAITWAIWGKARASADELIRIGSKEMEVEFEFELEGNTFRVIRKRSLGKVTGKSDLQFQIYDSKKQAFRSETGIGIRDTEKKINQTLRMDYDTFINSAFILQDRADEFTTKSPSERKQILADILGLAIYDELGELAKNYRNLAELEINTLTQSVNDMKVETAKKSIYKNEIDELTREQKKLKIQIQKADEDVSELKDQKREYDNKKRQLDELSKQGSEFGAEVQSIKTRIQKHEQKLAEFEKVIQEKEIITTGYQNLQALECKEEELNRKLDRDQLLNKEKLQLKQTIQSKKHEIELERRSIEDKLEDLQKKSSRVPKAREKLEELNRKLEKFRKIEVELDQVKTLGLEARAKKDGLPQIIESLNKEIDELQEKLSILRKSKAECPLCKQNLSIETRGNVIGKLAADVLLRTRKIEETENEANSLDRTILELRKDYETLEIKLKDKSKVDRQIAELELEIKDASTIPEEIGKLKVKLAAIDRKISSGEYSPKEIKTIGEIENGIKQTGYDPDLHKGVRKELKEFEKFRKLKFELDAAEIGIGEGKKNLEEATEAYKKKKEQISEISARLSELEKEVKILPKLEKDIGDTEEIAKKLHIKDKELSEQLGGSRTNYDRCIRLESEVKQKEKAIKEATVDRTLYNKLNQIFGKNGIQAMIIENAIPEIETEANSILSRITDNAMHLTLETQRDKKTGGVAETFEIKISDELGTRNYDLYSGGEAFRINFAIRIALSKLLARRAGAKLQMLVIDEGFGTQDARGIDRLIQTINQIKEDFEKIIVITHLQDFKDAFQTRIEVTKDPELGSTYRIT